MDDRADLVRRDLLKIIQQLKTRIDNQAQNKTTTGCVITVLATVDVASAGLDTIGIRT